MKDGAIINLIFMPWTGVNTKTLQDCLLFLKSVELAGWRLGDGNLPTNGLKYWGISGSETCLSVGFSSDFELNKVIWFGNKNSFDVSIDMIDYLDSQNLTEYIVEELFNGYLLNSEVFRKYIF